MWFLDAPSPATSPAHYAFSLTDLNLETEPLSGLLGAVSSQQYWMESKGPYKHVSVAEMAARFKVRALLLLLPGISALRAWAK